MRGCRGGRRPGAGRSIQAASADAASALRPTPCTAASVRRSRPRRPTRREPLGTGLRPTGCVHRSRPRRPTRRIELASPRNRKSVHRSRPRRPTRPAPRPDTGPEYASVHRSRPRRPTRRWQRRRHRSPDSVSIDQGRVGRRGLIPSPSTTGARCVHRSRPRRPTRLLQLRRPFAGAAVSIDQGRVGRRGQPPHRHRPDQRLCPSIKAASADAALPGAKRRDGRCSVHRSRPRRPTRRIFAPAQQILQQCPSIKAASADAACLHSIGDAERSVSIDQGRVGRRGGIGVGTGTTAPYVSIDQGRVGRRGATRCCSPRTPSTRVHRSRPRRPTRPAVYRAHRLLTVSVHRSRPRRPTRHQLAEWRRLVEELCPSIKAASADAAYVRATMFRPCVAVSIDQGRVGRRGC